MKPCPLHSQCELYLRDDQCEYRNGKLTYEEAESIAYDLSGGSSCTEWADNE